MVQALVRVDSWIIDRIFEPIYEQVFRRYEISNFTIAKYLIMVSSAISMIPVMQGRSGWFIEGIAILYISAVGLKTAITQETKWLKQSHQGIPENSRTADRSEVRLRLMSLALTIVESVLSVIWLIKPRLPAVGFACFLAGLYFIACMPRTPTKRTKRVESARNATV